MFIMRRRQTFPLLFLRNFIMFRIRHVASFSAVINMDVWDKVSKYVKMQKKHNPGGGDSQLLLTPHNYGMWRPGQGLPLNGEWREISSSVCVCVCVVYLEYINLLWPTSAAMNN